MPTVAAPPGRGLAPPEMDEKLERVQTQLEWARSLAIATPEAFTDAGESLKGIKSLVKEIEAVFGPMKQKASEAHKAIVAEEKRQLAPLVEAEALCKRAMLSYQDAERRKAEEERRRLQAEADERARKEREALERKAAAAKNPETRAKYEEAASQVAPAPVIHVTPATPKVAGISTLKTWKFRVVDPMAIPREFLMIDEKRLGQYARAMGDRAAVAGVQFYTEETLSARG